VPINVRVIEWDADNPPADWATVIRRWELIDVYCFSAAILASRSSSAQPRAS
jgi:hypothetical protein